METNKHLLINLLRSVLLTGSVHVSITIGVRGVQFEQVFPSRMVSFKVYFDILIDGISSNRQIINSGATKVFKTCLTFPSLVLQIEMDREMIEVDNMMQNDIRLRETITFCKIQLLKTIFSENSALFWFNFA